MTTIDAPSGPHIAPTFLSTPVCILRDREGLADTEARKEPSPDSPAAMQTENALRHGRSDSKRRLTHARHPTSTWLVQGYKNTVVWSRLRLHPKKSTESKRSLH